MGRYSLHCRPIKYGSITTFVCTNLLQQTIIQELYDNLTSCLRLSEEQNTYDVAFAKEIEHFLPGGLLRGETKLCRNCFKALNKKNNKSSTPGTATYNLPKDSLIYGLFPGSVLVELKKLNNIEISMVSMYSSISKISLQGGKNFNVNSAMSYTIVNDITSVAQRLLRMPSIESIAILRHGSGLNAKDYKYRPYFVKEALKWLVANNHLYSGIESDWRDEIDWDDEFECVEAPYLPLTENHIGAMDEDQDSVQQLSKTKYCKRSCVFYKLISLSSTYLIYIFFCLSIRYNVRRPRNITYARPNDNCTT